jgi:hypothetical protein
MALLESVVETPNAVFAMLLVGEQLLLVSYNRVTYHINCIHQIYGYSSNSLHPNRDLSRVNFGLLSVCHDSMRLAFFMPTAAVSIRKRR